MRKPPYQPSSLPGSGILHSTRRFCCSWESTYRRQNSICASGVARPRSLSTVIRITCTQDTVGLDSHHATSRRHSSGFLDDLLDCGAAVGMHDSGPSDDSPGTRMLQAYCPNVRFDEHAAVALLLQDRSSARHNDGCDKQPSVRSGITNSCGPPCSKIATVLGLV